MPDPRVVKLAEIMVDYSLELKPGQQVWLRTSPVAQEFNLAFYEKAVRAGAHVFVDQSIPGAEEAFYKHASDAQLDFVPPYRKLRGGDLRRLAAGLVGREHALAGRRGSQPAGTRPQGGRRRSSRP